MTEQPLGVYAAIARVQSKLDPIVADEEAIIPGKYSYRYASLPQIWRTLRPLLADAGLAITYSLSDGAKSVVCCVAHPESKSHIQIEVPLLSYAGTMQGLGGVITYARRYALHLLFALAIEGEDKDLAGDGGKPKAAGKRPRQPAAPLAPAPSDEVSTSGEKLNKGQTALVDGALARRAREIGGTPSAISQSLKRRHGWVSIEDCPPDRLNDLLAEIRSWEPGPDPEPEQPELA